MENWQWVIANRQLCVCVCSVRMCARVHCVYQDMRAYGWRLVACKSETRVVRDTHIVVRRRGPRDGDCFLAPSLHHTLQGHNHM